MLSRVHEKSHFFKKRDFFNFHETRLIMKTIVPCFLLFLLLLPVVANSNSIDLGQNAFQQGQFKLAIQYWENALTQFEANGQNTQYIDTAVQLAMAYQSLGFSPKAENILFKAKSRAEDMGDQLRRANVLSHLGDVYISLGEWQNAQASLNQAQRIAHSIQSPLLLANILNKQGNLWMIRGDLSKAFQQQQAHYQLCLPSKTDADEKPKFTDKVQECESDNQDSMLTNEELASYDLTCLEIKEVQQCLIKTKIPETFSHCIEITSINNKIWFTESALDCLAISHGIEKYQQSLENPINDKMLISKIRLNIAQALVKKRVSSEDDDQAKSAIDEAQKQITALPNSQEKSFALIQLAILRQELQKTPQISPTKSTSDIRLASNLNGKQHFSRGISYQNVTHLAKHIGKKLNFASKVLTL